MRRCIGVIIVLTIFLLVWLPHLLWRYFDVKMPWWYIEKDIFFSPAFYIFILGAIGALLNFHLSWTRPLLYKLRYGSMESYKFVSGLPLIPTVMVVFSAIYLTPLIWPCIVATALLLLDTAGPVWFLIGTWKDDSFWNPPGKSERDRWGPGMSNKKS